MGWVHQKSKDHGKEEVNRPLEGGDEDPEDSGVEVKSRKGHGQDGDKEVIPLNASNLFGI
jgi:hypothetical protein